MTLEPTEVGLSLRHSPRPDRTFFHPTTPSNNERDIQCFAHASQKGALPCLAFSRFLGV